MFTLIWANISQRPTRTAVTAMAVALGVVLLLVSIGLTNGVMNDSAERTRQVGGDFIVQGANSSLMFALDSGTLAADLDQVIESVDGVEAVTPILTKFIQQGFHLVFGIDRESFQRVNESLRLVEGRFFEAPNEIIIDTIYSSTKNLALGDSMSVLGRDFVISGIFEEGTASRVMMRLDTLQAMNATDGKVSMFFVAVAEGQDQELVFDRLEATLTGYKITRTAELQELMASTTPVYTEFISAMVFVAVAISFLFILLAMYSTITERTREIGILKSLGASKAYIVRLILRESVLICSLGAMLGFVLTFAAVRLILVAFPSMHVVIPMAWQLAAVTMAIGAGALGAVYPAVMAARLDPLRALGYE